MKLPILAALPLLALASQAHAAPIVTHSSYLPPLSQIFAPTPTSTSSGTATTVSAHDAPGTTYVGLTQSYPVAKSPFKGVAGYENAPFDAVTGFGFACFGTCGEEDTAVRVADTMTGSGSLSFIYGSPDLYNSLTLYTSDGIFNYTGAQLTAPGLPTGKGYEYVTISGLGDIYGVKFASTGNSFEFSAVLSAVPLPASAPMFGAALVALGALGYGLKRKKAPTAA